MIQDSCASETPPTLMLDHGLQDQTVEKSLRNSTSVTFAQLEDIALPVLLQKHLAQLVLSMHLKVWTHPMTVLLAHQATIAMVLQLLELQDSAMEVSTVLEALKMPRVPMELPPTQLRLDTTLQ